MQKAVTEFKSECGRAKVYVDNDLPIGVFHDFLLTLKGLMVDRMRACHQEQETEAKQMMENPVHESEMPSPREEERSSSNSECESKIVEIPKEG